MRPRGVAIKLEPTVRGFVAAGLLGPAALGLSGRAAEPRGALLPTGPVLGGTLRVGVDHPFGTDPTPGSAEYALDPQFEYPAQYWEIYRCCLLRTLFSYSGQSTAEGGATLRPDLAAARPSVSRDGLTWVFRLKRGLHYAPPFQGRGIVAGDVVRALEREFRLGVAASYSFYYTVIEGTNAFAAHRADSISGLEVPDPHTLVVHLTEPTADLPYRFSLPATAPIPAGADRGHDDGYGRYLVSSGPYMIAGSEGVNFALPPEQQRPAVGWHYRYRVEGGRVAILGREWLTLVRNPSWDSRSDRLRKAYPNRILFEMRGTPNSERLRNAQRIDRGALDLVLDNTAPIGQVRRYERGVRLRRRVHLNAVSGLWYITMNLAVPPFDDVHVRRAVNLAVNRTAVARIQSGSEPITPTQHDFPDSVEGNLLASYRPYPLRGDIAAAKTEMSRSRYDHNHDGRCDAPACRRIVAYGFSSSSDRPLWETDALVRRELARIGVRLVVRHPSVQVGDQILGRPRSRVALVLATGWLVDYPDAASFAPVLQHPTDSDNNDVSLLGAAPAQLRRWGYRRRSVPSVDAKIAECRALLGGLRQRCWAELDQLLSESIVPWVPRGQIAFTAVTSARVASYSFDQFAAAPALDRIALKHLGG